MKSKKSLIYFLFAIFLLLGLVFHAISAAKEEKDTKFVKVFVGHIMILAETAETPAERELGLGGRENLAENHGMLFIFDIPDYYGFWMKDTLVPLDMIWIDQNKKVIDIKQDVLPTTFPEVFYPKERALYVLETRAGAVQSGQINIGDLVSF